MISVLATTSTEFPMNMWDDLLPQIEITINTLRPYALDPSISAYCGVHGHNYDFKSHPIAPCGIKVLVHEPNRSSWAAHGVRGFYLGPALAHYRCYNIFIPSTGAIRISNSVAWLPEKVKLPGSSAIDVLYTAIQGIEAAFELFSCSGVLDDARRTRFATLPSIISNALTEAATIMLQSDNSTTQQQHQQPLTLYPEPDFRAPSHWPPHSHIDSNFNIPRPPGFEPLPHQRVLNQYEQVQRVLNQDEQVQRVLNQDEQVQRVKTPLTGERDTPSTQPHAVDNAATNINETAAVTPSPSRPTRNRRLPERYRRDTTLATLSHMQSVQIDNTRESEVIEANAIHGLTEDGDKLTYRKAMLGPDSKKWMIATEQEFNRLIHSGTMQAIQPCEQPDDRKKNTTYINPKVRQKIGMDGETEWRVRGTMGGDLISYSGDKAANVADMETVKIAINSVVSERATGKTAYLMTLDIKDYYLGTPFPTPEYVRIPMKLIPPIIIQQHALKDKIHKDSVIFQVNKCMYGLPQAGKLERLIAHLAEHGYTESSSVPCLFQNKERGTWFTLVVDDFLVKYTHKDHADHLIATLNKLYEIKIDYQCKKYLGYNIVFNDISRTVALSMPTYVPKMLARFVPEGFTRAVNSPAVYTPPSYGSKLQHEYKDNSTALDATEKRLLQEIVGSLLFYAPFFQRLTTLHHFK